MMKKEVGRIMMSRIEMNPIKLARERIPLSRHQFALLIGISYPTLWAVESGSRIKVPKKILRSLQDLGVDVTGLKDSYDHWRMARQKEIREELRSKMAGGKS